MSKKYLLIFLLAVIVAMFAGFLASSFPDGLEKVASNLGFENKAISTPAVFIDYQLPAIPNAAISNLITIVIATIIIIFIFKSIANAMHIGEFLKMVEDSKKHRP